MNIRTVNITLFVCIRIKAGMDVFMCFHNKTKHFKLIRLKFCVL
jgi:hypothetical protein